MARPLSRSCFGARDSVEAIWRSMGLPASALASLRLTGNDDGELGLPSSFKVGHLAQAAIALSALTAALVHAHRTASTTVPRVTVPLQHAAVEFKSEKLYRFAGPRGNPSAPPAIGGLHRTSDGWVRVHDAFPHHRDGTVKLLGLGDDAAQVTREQVAAAIARWAAIDLENVAVANGVVIAALRTDEQWACLPQSTSLSDWPIQIRKIADTDARGLPPRIADKCLRGVRVVEMTRVVAGPVAGRTLAAHGADVLWVTSPTLPDLPFVDRDTARGKRTIQLDLDDAADHATLHALLADADVFIQGFRPGSLVGKSASLGPDALARLSPGIICANLSAYGPVGPWSTRRGFDSIVQTCSGMNVSEAQHYSGGGSSGGDSGNGSGSGSGSGPNGVVPARPMPCQALDHASGYFLAAGITAALYRRATEGGSYQVDVSLAGTMKYLRSLGQYEGATGFACRNFETVDDVPAEYLETRATAFGEMTAVRHAADIEGVDVGWEEMPKPLGSDEPVWR